MSKTALYFSDYLTLFIQKYLSKSIEVFDANVSFNFNTCILDVFIRTKGSSKKTASDWFLKYNKKNNTIFKSKSFGLISLHDNLIIDKLTAQRTIIDIIELYFSTYLISLGKISYIK